MEFFNVAFKNRGNPKIASFMMKPIKKSYQQIPSIIKITNENLDKNPRKEPRNYNYHATRKINALQFS
jgi:hypothetical protein